jgi:enterochelin esterase-like enzyme/outer membrane protein assembly factor BamB
MRTRWSLAVLVLSLVSAAAMATDWSQYRGPQLSGSALGNALLDRDPMGLEIAWKRPLGMGYSSISVAGGVGVTMLGDGTDDVVMAFDAATGEELWRRRVAATYKGHSGSDDGPISTPAIHDGVVYALGPRGQLLALSLDDGAVVWSRTLGESDAKAPHYGFATAPLVAGELVVVQTGGEAGHSITAFDRASGEPRWAVENDPVSYQSPTLLELGGRRQFVAVNDKALLGLDAATGEVLWKHVHGTSPQEAFAHPLALGGDRLLLNSLAEAVALAVTPEGGGYAVEELWRGNGFQGSWSVPVHHEGYLYGFNRHFLTCLDAATGEVAWKSRPPGGQGLILVDGQLVVLTPGGEVVVAAATPEGYRERARLAVFAGAGGNTPPSFAAGRLYVRNLEEMAAVRVTDRPLPPAEEKQRELLGAFGEFVRRAEAAGDPASLVDAHLAAHDTFPIVEGDALVHFVYRGEVEDVALTGNFLPWGQEVELDRIAGTDVYFTSLELDPEAVWEYRFSVDFGQAAADPKNPLTTPSFMGPHSVLRMPRWEVPGHLAASDAPAGRVDSFQFRSEIAGNERRVRLYLPAGYGTDPEARYPLAVVLHGDSALEAGMDRALDNLIAAGEVAPLVVAFVPASSFMEYLGQPFTRMLAEELLPHLDRHYRTRTESVSRAIIGSVDGGAGALYAAFKAPGTFGKVAVQSVLTAPPLTDELPALFGGAKQPLQIVAELRRHDLKFSDTLDAATITRGLVDALRGAGYEVTVNEHAGAWGWSSWIAGLGEILGGFYPPIEVTD